MKKSFLPVILAAIFLLTTKGQSDDYWAYPELGKIYVSGRCLYQDNNGEITFSGLGKDRSIWATRIDSIGEVVFTKLVHYAISQASPQAILSAGKNSIIAGSGSSDVIPFSHAIIIKIDSYGNVIKDLTWIPSGYSTAEFNDMTKSNDGMYIAAG